MQRKENNSKLYKYLFVSFILNSFVLFFIGIKYFSYLDSIDYTFSRLYYLFSFTSHFTLIASIPLAVAFLAHKLSGNIKASYFIFYLLSIFNILLIKIDTLIYTQFRFHISPMILKMVFGKNASDIFHFSFINIIKTISLTILIISLQYFFYWVSKKVANKTNNTIIKSYSMILGLALIFSHLAYAWSDASLYTPITQSIETFPFYHPLTCESLLTKLNIIDTSTKKKNEKLYKLNNNSIVYPLSKIKTNVLTKKKNILVLMIDSWRYDCMDSLITPNIYKLSKKSQVFNNHHSGSNATADGVFTFFYGISGLCNKKFTNHQIGPVFIDELIKQEYKFQILSSATIENPPFNKNVFLKIKDLRLNSLGDSPSNRDIEITDEWLNKQTDRINQQTPNFDFLFFDAAHGFDYPKDYPIAFKPSLNSIDYTVIDDNYDPEYFYNTYKNSLHFIDNQIGKVLNNLEKNNKLENTTIIITGDHGQEFNDNKKGYWQHAGNYSKYQTQTPLIVFDNLKAPKSYNHITLHYDVIPTIMKDNIGVTNNINEFSIGKSLYDQSKRDWFLCGYKNTYAVIQEKIITKIYRSSGIYTVTDKNLNKISDQTIDYDIFQKALNKINQFYLKPKK